MLLGKTPISLLTTTLQARGTICPHHQHSHDRNSHCSERRDWGNSPCTFPRRLAFIFRLPICQICNYHTSYHCTFLALHSNLYWILCHDTSHSSNLAFIPSDREQITCQRGYHKSTAPVSFHFLERTVPVSADSPLQTQMVLPFQGCDSFYHSSCYCHWLDSQSWRSRAYMGSESHSPRIRAVLASSFLYDEHRRCLVCHSNYLLDFSHL